MNNKHRMGDESSSSLLDESVANKVDVTQHNNTSSISDRVLFIGPVPPPVSGMAAVNSRMIELIADRVDVKVLNTLPPQRRRSLAYLATKAWLVARAALAIFAHRLGGGRTLYASVDDDLGMAGNVAFALCARLIGLNIFLHHHSYKYILLRSRQMSLLVFAAGSQAHHIFLCNCMRDKFESLYPGAKRHIIVPNAVDQKEGGPAPSEAVHHEKFTIGMLSNLSFEKGLAEFLEIALHREDIHAVLAGPANTPAEEHAILNAGARLGDRLQWLGSVHGRAKRNFFRQIDLFVFPTRYRTEAYPLVIVEALVEGRPVIAWDRGCIGEFATFESVFVVPREKSFVSTALELLDNPSLRQHTLKVTAAREGNQLNRENMNAMAALADQICAVRKEQK